MMGPAAGGGVSTESRDGTVCSTLEEYSEMWKKG